MEPFQKRSLVPYWSGECRKHFSVRRGHHFWGEGRILIAVIPPPSGVHFNCDDCSIDNAFLVRSLRRRKQGEQSYPLVPCDISIQ